MDSNNWRPDQPPPPVDSGGDWRAQFQPDSRQKIVNKIMETLKRHLPCSGQEGLMELKKIAARFEEKIYTSATSQTDYLKKISLKMLTMESKSQNTGSNAMPSNSVGGSRNPSDPASSQSMQPQVRDPSQSVPAQMISNQSQAVRQQLVAQNNMQNSIASSGVQTTVNPMPPVSGLTQNPTQNVAQNLNISGIPQNSMGNNMNQGGVNSSMFANVQRQMQARQLGMQQPPQQQSQNQFMYQQQLQHHQMMKQKMQQGNNIQQMLQTPMQQQPPQQQTNLLQATNQLQSSQQPIMQTSSATMQPSMISGMQQNQHQQSVLRQQQQQQQQHQQQQQTPVVQQQPMMPPQQQQSLMGQRQNAVNVQQNSLIAQQGDISDMQQQHQRLLGQQNSIPNNSQNLQQQQQQLMGQQSNISNMNPQQLGHQNHTGGLAQQQQMMAPQSGSTGMQQTNQHSVHMMQQTKGPLQQQQPQNVPSLLTGGQQLQQNIGMQQQPNSFQQNMQQRIQTQSPLLQHQNVIDQQKQLFQPQRVPADGPSTSLDSTAQTGGTSAGDWQEEVSQKIKAMKDLYYADLNDLYQKVSNKLQQYDSLPQPPKSEQLEKLRGFKQTMEKLLQILQTTKNNILPFHRDKLSLIEKQIISSLSQRPRKPMPPMQQGQIQLPQAQSSHDSGAKPQLQSRNLQGAVATTMQHGSMPSLSAVGSSQQSPNLDSGSGTAPNSMQQQVAMGSLQQNPVSAQTNINPMQPQSGVNNMLQQNMNPLQPNSNMLQGQHHLKQQLQSRHIQQQILQKQQLLQQQQQRLQLQAAKQQQMQAAHQMPQVHQPQDINDLKMRQGLGLARSGAFPSHLSSVQQRYAHQQLKPGASLPVSSPQLVASPQINQHSSPQIDQQNMSQTVRTPLQSANSPFAPSPSTPMAPSPMPGGDPEKPVVASLSNATANVGPPKQTTNNAAAPSGAPQSLAIGTPGISASPFLEVGATDGAHGNSSMVLSGKSSVTEQPLERLLKAVKSISSKALTASVSDIGTVINMVDCNSGSAPGTGSRATVGEDLVTMTKCRLQARNFLIQDGTIGTKRARRSISATPLIVAPSAGSMDNSFEQFTGSGASELESTATSIIKKARIEVNHRLLEEIREINECLIDTYVDISDEDVDLPIASTAVGSNGTVVRCCFNAVSLSPSLKSLYTSAHMSPIEPLRMLVPSNYPNCSPIFLEKLPVKACKEQEDLSVKAKTRFSIALRGLSQPMSLNDMIRTWDDCARTVISEYAQQSGGGTFTSKYGAWENCLDST